ncbi:MAG TPA: hypothetical protein VND93_14875 [Myxococcales bacterium]|nr:hypothetical protein [Myxococcales bacterium]
MGLVVLALTSCAQELRERCRFVTEHVRSPVLPPGFAQVDGLIVRRTLSMTQDVRELRGSLARSFRIYYGEETLPILCGRLEQARQLAASGRAREAGVKYQALLVSSQVFELAVAVQTFSEYADATGVPVPRILEMQELFLHQMGPLLEAALSEDAKKLERALAAHAAEYGAWVEQLGRWSSVVGAQIPRLKVARIVWDVLMLVIATHDAATAAADLAAAGRPPMPPLPAFAVGGEAATLGISEAAYLELVEALRKLIASGVIDAGIVVGLSHLGASPVGPPGLDLPVTSQMAGATRAPGASPGESSGAERAARFGQGWQRASLRETIERIAGPRPVVTTTASGKTIYANPSTGLQVVYDRAGNYFRIENPAANGPTRYLDQFGKPIPPNTPVVGPKGTTMTGVPADVRNALTHFLNSDPLHD